MPRASATSTPGRRRSARLIKPTTPPANDVSPPKHRKVASKATPSKPRKARRKKTKLISLPVEIITQIYGDLDQWSSVALVLTCKRLHAISVSNSTVISTLHSLDVYARLARLQLRLQDTKGSFSVYLEEFIAGERFELSKAALLEKSKRNEDVIRELAHILMTSHLWWEEGRSDWGKERVRMALVRLWTLQVLFWDRDGEYFLDLVSKPRPAHGEGRYFQYILLINKHKWGILNSPEDVNSYPAVVRTIVEYFISTSFTPEHALSPAEIAEFVKSKMEDVAAVAESLMTFIGQGKMSAYIDDRLESLLKTPASYSKYGRAPVDERTFAGMILFNGGLASALDFIKRDANTLCAIVNRSVWKFEGYSGRERFGRVIGWICEMVKRVAYEGTELEVGLSDADEEPSAALRRDDGNRSRELSAIDRIRASVMGSLKQALDDPVVFFEVE